MDLTESELVRQAQYGDRKAFSTLVDRYKRMVTILVHQKVKDRVVAADLIDEALDRAFRSLCLLRDPEKFGGRLYHQALKVCLAHLHDGRS